MMRVNPEMELCFYALLFFHSAIGFELRIGLQFENITSSFYALLF